MYQTRGTLIMGPGGHLNDANALSSHSFNAFG